MRKTLLITILAFLFSFYANSQCTISVPSSLGYVVNVTLKATSIVATTPCVFGYNYNVAIEYNVTFTGSHIPSKLNTLQGNLYCGVSPNFFSLPLTGGSGTVLSRSNVLNPNSNCASATVSSLSCNTFELQIQGPGISNQLIKCGTVLTPVCYAGTNAPALSTSTVNNICPASTVNLSTIIASNVPSNAVLEWHTATHVTALNKVALTGNVSAGTYYAVFFDALNNCYSNTSTAVNVAISTCSGISSGNEGGLESDGCLAEAISKRNYQRIKTPSVLADGKAISYDNPRDLQMFNEPAKGALGTRGDTELESFIPLKPFANTVTAFMTSPNDLIGVTNAKKVLSVDYFDNATQKRLAAVLTTKTADKVYDHTKVICDRLIGSQLLSTQRIVLDNKPFIMSTLQRENGAIEYNINFSVNKVNATTATVTSQWAIDEYPSKPDYWNFQVWAQSPDLTQKLAIEILNKFKEQFATLNSTIEPSIPKVFVKKGSYDNGTLTLVIQNPIGAKHITLSGNYTSSETNKRETISKTVTLSGEKEETIELVVGSIFDFGFNLRNEKSTEYDALYFADGAWGLDYDKNVSKVESYEVNSTIPFFQDGVYTVERTPILRGVVKDYVSLFRSLRPASQATNLSTYQNLSFKASGTSVIEVTLVKKSIADWSKQYRTEIKLYTDMQNYSLALKDFKNGTNEPINADDLVDIVFTIKGDGKTSKPFEMTIDNVVFDNKINSTLKAGAVLTAFPNPASESTELIFDMPERGVSEISLTNTNGKKVIQRTEEFAKGNNRIMLMLNTLPSGIYVASITTAKGKITAKVIIP